MWIIKFHLRPGFATKSESLLVWIQMSFEENYVLQWLRSFGLFWKLVNLLLLSYRHKCWKPTGTGLCSKIDTKINLSLLSLIQGNQWGGWTHVWSSKTWITIATIVFRSIKKRTLKCCCNRSPTVFTTALARVHWCLSIGRVPGSLRFVFEEGERKIEGG